MTRILIADDQELVRAGFAAILVAEPGFEVVAEAANGSEAVDQARELRPDLILMDVRMPELDGIEATRRIRALPEPPRVLMLTTFDLDQYVYEAIKAGASGFLLKDVPRAQLISAVHTIIRGDALLAPQITRRLIEDFVRRPPPGTGTPPELDQLTERELEVLDRSLSVLTVQAASFCSCPVASSHVVRTSRGVR
jgi:DNA-binding NarL/FixJ family response regulator